MTRLRQLWLLTALGMLAVMAGGYFLLVSPQSNKAAALKEETDTQVALSRQLKSQIDQLHKQRKDLPEQQALLARFAGLIPNNPALPRLIRALTDAADNSGVELLNIDPTLPVWAKGVNAQTRVEVPGKVPAPNGQVLVDIPVAIKVAGLYPEVEQFFDEVEEMNRAMLVSGFKIERPKQVLRPRPDGVVEKVNPNLIVVNLTAHVMMTRQAPATSAPTTPVTSDTDAAK